MQVLKRIIHIQSYKTILQLLGWFSFFYGGTYAFIGLNASGGRFDLSDFTHYIDYVTTYRNFILNGASFLLQTMDYAAVREGEYILRINNYNGIALVYECLGIGVISFWLAFIITDESRQWKQKCLWLIAGMLIISFSNMLRIDLLLIAGLKGWKITGDIEHHTAYNWVLYAIVIAMVFIYQSKKIKA